MKIGRKGTSCVMSRKVDTTGGGSEEERKAGKLPFKEELKELTFTFMPKSLVVFCFGP